jgi:uncharacterized membrane protein YgaE (UPF0421/DUF939 family)
MLSTILVIILGMTFFFLGYMSFCIYVAYSVFRWLVTLLLKETDNEDEHRGL